MNKVMDPMKTAQTMKEFEKQNMKMSMTEEMSKNESFNDSDILRKHFFQFF